MKLIYLLKNMGVSIVLGLSLFASALGMENINDITYHKVKAILEGHLEKNPGLLDSSKDKDIVVFLGDTGSGKSTLINYLSGKGLRADHFNNIVLENTNDASAMVIGKGAESETFLPRFIPVGDLLFYDLPGFKDTRGTANSLVNACFIKSIIENARSTRLIFVVGVEQINEGRADSFIKLSSQAKQLVPNKPIENFSGLVITKSQVSKDVLPQFLGSNLELTNPDLSMISNWIAHQRIDQVSMPMNGQINYENRETILNLIREIEYGQMENIDVGTVYNASQQIEIKAIYDTVIEDTIDKLIAENGCGLSLISGHTLQFMGESPVQASLSLITPGELGVFSVGDKLYCKVHDKETIEITDLSLGSSERVMRSLKDTVNMEQLNVVLQQEKGSKKAFAAFNNNIAYEGITLSDLEALLQFTSSCSYTTLDKGALESKKDYISNGLNQDLSLSLERSPLIKLLRPISEGIYQSSWHTCSQNLIIRVQNIAALLNEEIAKQEMQTEEARRIQAEQARQAEEMRRIQAEQARQAEEARRIQAEQAKQAAETRRIQAEREATAASLQAMMYNSATTGPPPPTGL